jgi:hypothetical protein
MASRCGGFVTRATEIRFRAVDARDGGYADQGHMWTARWQALFSVQTIWSAAVICPPIGAELCPLALMKSDDQNPYQVRELCAHSLWRVVPGVR